MAVSKTWKMFAFEMLISCKSFFTHLENKVYAFKMIPIEFFFQYHDRWNGSQCIPRLWMMNYVSGPKMKEKLLSMDFSNVHAVFLDFQYFFHPENRKPTIQQCKDLYSLTDMESDVPNSNKVCFEDAWVTTMLFVLNKSPDLLDDLIDFSCEKPSVKRILNRICTFKYRRNHSIADQWWKRTGARDLKQQQQPFDPHGNLENFLDKTDSMDPIDIAKNRFTDPGILMFQLIFHPKMTLSYRDKFDDILRSNRKDFSIVFLNAWFKSSAK